MQRSAFAIGVVLTFLVITSGVEAQKVGEESKDELLDVSGWAAVAIFFVGSAILILSVEVLIHALVRTASRFGVSALLLAVVFSGMEVDNVAFGLFTGFAEMQHVAFGLAVGNAISIFGLTLGLAALLYPFEIDVPDDYVLLMVASPLLLFPLLVQGRVTQFQGVGLLVLYALIFGYIARKELSGDRSYMRSEEVMEASTSADGRGTHANSLPEPVRQFAHYHWFWPLVIVAALGGIVIGAEIASTGTEGIVNTWHISETIFGITLVTIIFTIDDILLTVEPIRLGYYDVGVGGVIGSLLFFVTANTGIIALMGTITTSPLALHVHLPVLIGITALSGYFLWHGELTRKIGLLLLSLYMTYIAVNVHYFAQIPVNG